MSTLSDVQDLYGGIQKTWTANRAHVFAHLIVFGLIFALWEVPLPSIAMPHVDPRQITESSWFVLAKESGIIYATLVIPFVVVSLYAAVLRGAGSVALAIMLLVAQPRHSLKRSNFLNEATLEPLALLIQSDSFTLSELVSKAAEISTKYRGKTAEKWKELEDGLTRVSKNAQVYYGDFVIAALVWTILFVFERNSPWWHVAPNQFWWVLACLAVLLILSGVRVWRVLQTLPTLSVVFISVTLRSDPDFPAVSAATAEQREKVQLRLTKLFDEEEANAGRDPNPSLAEYLRHVLDLAPRVPSKRAVDTKEGEVPRRGFPFRELYQRGQRFSWDKELNANYAEGWLANYMAWRYYRLVEWLRGVAQILGKLIGYLLFGSL